MKRSFVYFLAFVILFAVSCKKLIEAVFPGEDITLEELDVSIPPIPYADSAVEFSAGSFTVYINTDSIIRSNTNGVFGINSVASVKVKQLTMKAHNTDSINNLSALKSFRIAITSNTNSTAQSIVQADIPVTAVDSYITTPANSPDITSYLNGTYITYTVYCRARSTTIKTLNLLATIVVTAK